MATNKQARQIEFESMDYQELVNDFIDKAGYTEDEAREAASKVREEEMFS